MNRLDLILRVRSYTRDFSNSIFREQDITSYINEGINRFKEIIPEFKNEIELIANDQSPTLIPVQYHHLLALYSASRCFFQDERQYQATTLMNEFEVKLEELLARIEDGRVVIIDPTTTLPVVADNPVDYVDLKSYWDKKDQIDVDLGVEGVQ